MNRLVSNLILGFFALVLMAVYGFAKQPTVYGTVTRQSIQSTDDQSLVGQTTRRVILPNGATIVASVVDTPETLQRGLSGLDVLESDTGMLFVFAQSGQYPMWMKDMKMPVDMVWLNEEGDVVHLATDVPVLQDDQGEPPIYVNDTPAKYVLELEAGKVEKSGIQEGDKLVLS